MVEYTFGELRPLEQKLESCQVVKMVETLCQKFHCLLNTRGAQRNTKLKIGKSVANSEERFEKSDVEAVMNIVLVIAGVQESGTG